MTELLNNIGEVIRNLAAFFVLSTILLRLLPGEVYARYLRFFLGLLLVVFLLKPIISALSAEDLFEDALDLSADVLSLSADGWERSTDALGLDADSFAEQLESGVAAVSADGWGSVLEAYQGDIQEQVNAQIADLGASVTDISLDDDGESLIFVIEKAGNQTDSSVESGESKISSIGAVRIEIPVISVFDNEGEEDGEKKGEEKKDEEVSGDEVAALIRTRIAGYCGISEDAVEVIVGEGW